MRFIHIITNPTLLCVYFILCVLVQLDDVRPYPTKGVILFLLGIFVGFLLHQLLFYIPLSFGDDVE